MGACTSEGAHELVVAEGRFASVCGSRADFQRVDLYKSVKGVPRSFVQVHARPVGRLSYRRLKKLGARAGQPLCTGTLISRDLFLTAKHCVEHRGTPGAEGDLGLSLPPDEGARLLEVEFEDRGARRSTKSYYVTGIEHLGSAALDYAVLRLEGRPGLRYGSARLDAEEPVEGANVVVIQHPAGGPKQVSIGAVRGQEAGGRILKHDADTDHGSSGAALLDLRGRLVGLHPLGGCDDAAAGFLNRGVSVAAILDDAPSLRALLGLFCQHDCDCPGVAGCATGTCMDGTCSVRSLCAEDDPCAEALCDPRARTCSIVPRDCDDMNPCTVDLCDARRGCVALTDGTECLPCGEEGRCISGACQPNQRLLRFDGPSDLTVFSELQRFGVVAEPSDSVGLSLRTDPLADEQRAVLTLWLDLAAPGLLKFRHRESTERGFDVLSFWIDGLSVASWSGANPWSTYETPLSAGGHELRWEYVKDDMFSVGEDAVWLDDISLPSEPGPCP